MATVKGLVIGILSCTCETLETRISDGDNLNDLG